MPRNLVKRPVMTIPYGVTRYGIQDQLIDELRHGRTLAVANEMARDIADCIVASIGKVIAAAEKAMGWLQGAAEVASEYGRPLRWTTALGLEVVQDYRRPAGEDKRINVFIGGRRVQLKVAHDSQVIDKRRQTNGVSPNFVHSLDATHLMMAALACRENGIPLATVHDSYSTHAGHMEDLGAIIRRTFVSLYQDDWLADFRLQLQAQLPAELAGNLPDLPALGDFDVAQVLKSPYFFA